VHKDLLTQLSRCCRTDSIIGRKGNTGKQGEHSVKAYVLRGGFVLLPLALALCVTPFALGQRRHCEFSERTLTFPISLLEQQPPKKQQVETTPDSVTHRRHALVSKLAEPRRAPPIEGVPSGIDCDNAPGIVIHDDRTADSLRNAITDTYSHTNFNPAAYSRTKTSSIATPAPVREKLETGKRKNSVDAPGVSTKTAGSA
jgi:hypothetical protein